MAVKVLNAKPNFDKIELSVTICHEREIDIHQRERGIIGSNGKFIAHVDVDVYNVHCI